MRLKLLIPLLLISLSAFAQEQIPDDGQRDPAAASKTSPVEEMKETSPSAPSQAKRIVSRIEILGGFGTKAYGHSIESEWKNQPARSPLIRVEIAREFWGPRRSFAFTIAGDLDYLRSVQTVSSSAASAEIVSDYVLYGASVGTMWNPAALPGFGFRASIGAHGTATGRTELRSGGYTATLKAADERTSVFGPRVQLGLTGTYQSSPGLKLIGEIHTFNSGTYLLAGLGHEL
ncbi:MAG: hypothetical protein AAB250_09115 [Bdellovibrionota bacterium]